MGLLREEPKMIRCARFWLVTMMLMWPLTATAQPRTIDGVAIDPDAELVVALADDTNNSAALGMFVIVLTTAMAVLAPVLSPADPVKNSLIDRLTPPMWNGTAKHPLGTDTLGRDVASRLLYGARVSLVVGLAAVAIAGVLGVALGLLSGYYRGWPDDVLMRLGDIQLAFPVLVLAVAVLAVLGASLATGWITYARIVRGEALSLRQRDFVEAAPGPGPPPRDLLWGPLFPQRL